MTIIKCISSLNGNLKSNKNISNMNCGSSSLEMNKNSNSGLIFAIIGATLGTIGGLLVGVSGGAVDGYKEGFTTAVTSLLIPSSLSH